MSQYKTLIFDLDGTLLDTAQDLILSMNYTLEQLGYPLRTPEEIRSFVGNGVGLLVARSVPEGTTEADTKKAVEFFRDYYEKDGHKTTAPFTGMTELLVKLKDQGYTMGVVSNKMHDPVKELCDKFFPGLFGATMGEQVGVPRKPEPDLVHKCLDALGADMAGAVYIGDSEVDYQTAVNSKLPCISVSWGFRSPAFLKEIGATTIVDTMDQLADLLL